MNIIGFVFEWMTLSLTRISIIILCACIALNILSGGCEGLSSPYSELPIINLANLENKPPCKNDSLTWVLWFLI